MSGIQIVQGPLLSNTQECVMANSISFDRFDPVKINSSGFLDLCAAGDKIDGFFAQADTTAASDNQTVGLVKAKYDPVDINMVIQIVADQACVQTDLGAYADIAVAAGVFTANLSAGASGQLYVRDFDPNRDGSTTILRCQVAEPQSLAFAQA